MGGIADQGGTRKGRVYIIDVHRITNDTNAINVNAPQSMPSPILPLARARERGAARVPSGRGGVRADEARSGRCMSARPLRNTYYYRYQPTYRPTILVMPMLRPFLRNIRDVLMGLTERWWVLGFVIVQDIDDNGFESTAIAAS